MNQSRKRLYGCGKNRNCAPGFGKQLLRSLNGDAPGAWSPDDRKIVYSSVVRGDRELYVMNADGFAKRRITRWRGPDSPNAWLPDGRIAFAHSTGGPMPRWYVVRPDGRQLPWLSGAADPIDGWTHP